MEHKGTILVGDDDDLVRECVQIALEAYGYRVVTAQDGEEMWEALDKEPPCLIVSDIDMPRLDGFHLADRIKNDATLNAIPIVIISGLTRDSKQTEKVWAQRLGVERFISKPFDPIKLAAVVDELLTRKHGSV